jgi:hypothetical protein
VFDAEMVSFLKESCVSGSVVNDVGLNTKKEAPKRGRLRTKRTSNPVIVAEITFNLEIRIPK